MENLKISEIKELNRKLEGGFSVLTPKQQEMLRGGADNCDCKNSKRCKIKEVGEEEIG